MAGEFNAGVIAAWRHSTGANRLENLRTMEESPYFGRVDFAESKSSKIEQLYVGKLTIYDQRYDILVYDWRAQVSRLYYLGTLGAASFMAPVGRISGTVYLHRRFEIKGGQLLGFVDVGGSPDIPAAQFMDQLLASTIVRLDPAICTRS